jgi:hypothetical protein
MIRKMAGIGAGWTDGRDLPPLAKKTFTELWQEKHRNSRPEQPVKAEEEN